MKTVKRLLALVLVLCMAFAIVACSSDDGETTDPGDTTDPGTSQNGEQPGESGGQESEQPDGTDGEGEKDTTLVIGDIIAPNTFAVTGNQYSHWETMVFDTLVFSDPEGNLLPGIATSWEYEDDTTLVLQLRDDVFCTNGEQITASDCLYSLRFWATETSQASGMTAYDLENSYADGDYTLVIKFSEVYGPGVNALINYYMWDEEWATNATGDDWWGAPNGSGPYTLVENVDGAYCSFQRKDEYWGELPEVTFVTYRYYSEPSTMFIDLENGEIDIAVNVQASDAERVMNNPDDYAQLAYENRPLIDNLNLFLCDYCEYWQDPNVREAFVLCLNASEIATGMYGVLFQGATSPMPTGIQFKIDCNVPEQNIERARELLEASAYPDGFELRLVVTTGQDLAATVIQAQAAQIGITVNVETYDPGTAVPMMQAGEVDIALRVGMGGASYRDACMGISDVFSRASTLRAVAQYDDEFNEHYDAGLYSVDEEVRRENYEWMQNWLIDNYMVYPICERCTFIAWDKDKVASCDAVVASYLSARWIDLV